MELCSIWCAQVLVALELCVHGQQPNPPGKWDKPLGNQPMQHSMQPLLALQALGESSWGLVPLCCLTGCTPSVLGAPGADRQCRKERHGCAGALLSHPANTHGQGSASPALHLLTLVHPTFFFNLFLPCYEGPMKAQ